LIAYEFFIKPILVGVCGESVFGLNYNNSLSLWNFDEYFLKSRVWTSAHLRNRAEGFDAGVRLAETVPLDMIAIPFGKTQQHIVVAAPSYLSGRRSPKTPTELKDHVCVRYRLPGGSIYAREFEKRGDVLRIDVAGPLTLTSDRLNTACVSPGMSLTTFSVVSFAKLECCLNFAPVNATMSQKHSLLQSA
jgi:hypothetical protein